MTRSPGGHRAVMEAHAPAVVAADDPQTALYRRLEYFPTPPWAARAGAERLLQLDPQARTARDPGCGYGHLVHGARGYFAGGVTGVDIHDYGGLQQRGLVDYLSREADALPMVDWEYMNPPFSLAAEWVRLGLQRARRGVAVFIRSGWLDSEGRYPFFYGDAPLGVEAPFFERVALKLGGWDPNASTATPYSWFFFFQPDAAPIWVRELQDAAGLAVNATTPIRPGTKARLTHPDDARLFGEKAAAPLLEGAA